MAFVRVGKVLGWIGTVLLILAVVAITVATEAIRPGLAGAIAVPGWVMWLIVAVIWLCLAGFLGVAVFGSRARARRRDVRERRRRLSNFDLD